MTATVQAEAGGPEYVTDVAYLRNFVEDLAPPRLRLCAALNGFSPPPAEGFAYAELGCGNGDTLAALAAAHPGASFVGVDMNPEHIAFAEGLASRGAIANVRFLAADFEGFGGHADLPDFDFIAAHGVMSWVSADKRRALVELAAQKLKPGGILTVSYNALPGWAAVEPLRRLMLDSAAGAAGQSLDRARHGLAAARVLCDAGAEYFTQNPAARSMLETAEKTGLPYVAHEYLHAHWSPLYFADVAREMAAAGLYFIGALPLFLNYKDVAFPPSVLNAVAGVENRVVLESLRDYATNEFFRRDLYVKGQVLCSPASTRAYLDATPFGAPAGVKREIRLPYYTLQLAGPIFDALIPALTERSAVLDTLARRPDLAPFGAAKIRDALLRLALGDQILPMARATEPIADPGPPPSLYRVPLPYNRAILEQRLSHKNLVALASPLSGTGHVLDMLQAVCLRLVTTVAPDERAAWIRGFVADNPIKLHDGARAVTDRGEQARIMEGQLAEFTAKKLPELRRLGIVDPTPGGR
jgi:SAM-dependent methyltransferase